MNRKINLYIIVNLVQYYVMVKPLQKKEQHLRASSLQKNINKVFKRFLYLDVHKDWHIVAEGKHVSNILDVLTFRGRNIDLKHYLVAAKFRLLRRSQLNPNDIGELWANISHSLHTSTPKKLMVQCSLQFARQHRHYEKTFLNLLIPCEVSDQPLPSLQPLQLHHRGCTAEGWSKSQWRSTQ